MLGLLSAYDEKEKSASKEKVSFLHYSSSTIKNIKIEVAPFALALARKFDLNKVYFYYSHNGKDKKIVYDYTL